MGPIPAAALGFGALDGLCEVFEEDEDEFLSESHFVHSPVSSATLVVNLVKHLGLQGSLRDFG